MTATLSPDDHTPDLAPPPGRSMACPNWPRPSPPRSGLEEKHRAMIDRLEAANLKQAQDAADSASRAGFAKLDAPERRNQDGREGRNDLRAASDDDPWAILRQLDALASALSAFGCCSGLRRWSRWPGRDGQRQAQRTIWCSFRALARRSLRTAACAWAAATLYRVLGASVAGPAGPDARKAADRVAAGTGRSLIGDDVRQARAAIAAVKQAHQRRP